MTLLNILLALLSLVLLGVVVRVLFRLYLAIRSVGGPTVIMPILRRAWQLSKKKPVRGGAGENSGDLFPWWIIGNSPDTPSSQNSDDPPGQYHHEQYHSGHSAHHDAPSHPGAHDSGASHSQDSGSHH